MDYLDNILAVYLRSTPTQRITGRRWYRRMYAVTVGRAVQSHLHADNVAAIWAAYSINTPWKRNIRLASRTMRNLAQGRDPLDGIKALTMSKRMILRALSGETLDTIIKGDNKHKIRSFAANMAGDHDRVTVDRWAYRIATNFADCPNDGAPCTPRGGNHACAATPKGQLYHDIADAYRTVAGWIGETPADLQAITWIVMKEASVFPSEGGDD